MSNSTMQIAKRLQNLEAHLAEENQDNPILFKAVQSYRELDQIAYRSGILTEEQSYATRVSWWPMIAVLGTFSAGKSTFINSYVGSNLQRTGTQAVDEKFTVITYSNQGDSKTLPGVALDADPRFPFFQISQKIAEISSAGPQRIDSFLQLKTCPSEHVRGKIVIDSPGFDADSQRDSTLRLTQHIIDLADLVLVFFDARHPEPGAMKDTLNYLVAATIDRADSNKFLYVLNQIDVTAREDNPEEVVAAWQRGLAQAGLTSGRFYRIYNPDVAVPIEDPQVRARYESKREADMEEIEIRMKQVEVERAYRVVGNLEYTAKRIREEMIPRTAEMLARWRKRVFWTEGLLVALVAIMGWFAISVTGTAEILGGYLETAIGNIFIGLPLLLLLVVGYLYSHFQIRGWAADAVIKRLSKKPEDEEDSAQLTGAFRKSTRWWRPLLMKTPSGWGNRSQEELNKVLDDANRYVQSLNDQFTTPSGE